MIVKAYIQAQLFTFLTLYAIQSQKTLYDTDFIYITDLSLPSSFGAKDCAKTAAIAEDSTKECFHMLLSMLAEMQRICISVQSTSCTSQVRNFKSSKNLLKEIAKRKTDKNASQPKGVHWH